MQESFYQNLIKQYSAQRNILHQTIAEYKIEIKEYKLKIEKQCENRSKLNQQLNGINNFKEYEITMLDELKTFLSNSENKKEILKIDRSIDMNKENAVEKINRNIEEMKNSLDEFWEMNFNISKKLSPKLRNSIKNFIDSNKDENNNVNNFDIRKDDRHFSIDSNVNNQIISRFFLLIY